MIYLHVFFPYPPKIMLILSLMLGLSDFLFLPKWKWFVARIVSGAAKTAVFAVIGGAKGCLCSSYTQVTVLLLSTMD